jgi:predicted 3-demethylubiquinone-9 3-methyltransferase (glyoxalase superfamily)
MHPQKISTCLWFDGQGEVAARFYVSLFPDSAIDQITPGLSGAPLMIDFPLAGVRFLALNGGPEFQFTEAISLSVRCVDQVEIDFLWTRLTDGGWASRCGWLKDRFGLSW